MLKPGSICVLAAALCAGAAALAADGAAERKVPIFATGPNTGWVLDRKIGPDDLIQPPEGGPGPVTYDKAHPYVPNNTPGMGP